VYAVMACHVQIPERDVLVISVLLAFFLSLLCIDGNFKIHTHLAMDCDAFKNLLRFVRHFFSLSNFPTLPTNTGQYILVG
jgi:hypothetical protein